MVDLFPKPPCIVTFQDAINEGAMLQCVCLARLVESATNQRPFVLDYRNPHRKAAYDGHPSKNVLLGFAKQAMRLSPAFDDEGAAAEWINDNASIAICGSDEIWKWPFPGCDRRFHCPSPNIYLGLGITIPKVAYSVSIGSSPAESYPEQFPGLLREFSLVAARDNATLRLVQRFRGAVKLSDPTLGVTLESVFPGYQEAAEQIAPKRPFTFLTDPWISEQFVREFAVGEVVTTLPSPYRNLGPQEPHVWAGLHGLASLVISHRFHSTLMAYLHDTPCRIYQERNKVLDFVAEAGLGQQPCVRPASAGEFLERCRSEHRKVLEEIFHPIACSLSNL